MAEIRNYTMDFGCGRPAQVPVNLLAQVCLRRKTRRARVVVLVC
jgi:hypothetical protein